MIVARTREALAAALAGTPVEPRRPVLVPTMGALHAGHLALVDRALGLGGDVAVSIFVNPLQFDRKADLEAYPRDLDRDLELLRKRGVGVVFAPSVEEMYPGGPPRVTVDPGPLGEILEGAHRPGHFRGVLTVVARLFGLFRPRAAVFGRKDFQQFTLVRQMVRDLELGVALEAVPTVREEDGLALSSRNALLRPEHRTQAAVLHRALQAARRSFREGVRDPGALRDRMETVLGEAPDFRPEYAEVVDPGTLEAPEAADPRSVAVLAGFLGAVRLIDNLPLEGP